MKRLWGGVDVKMQLHGRFKDPDEVRKFIDGVG